MAAIGTGPTLSDERVRQLLGDAIKLEGHDARLLCDVITHHELARLAQEILDLRTANGILEAVARHDDLERDTKATGQRGVTR